MQRCLQLAQQAMGNVAPNPLVGSVLVYDNNIIAEGFHEKYGMDHAEVNAIKNTEINHSNIVDKATLYVNLEPCCHYGKTPPCVDLIIEKKIPKIVIANLDINPIVAGKGIEKLRQNGVEVITGVLEKEGYKLNRRFFTFHAKKRPYIILKWAKSADNFITKNNDEPFWLTGKTAKKLVHLWRSQEQAILVGRQTVQTDNPLLTNRFFNSKNQPLRVIIDKDSKIDKNKNVFNIDANTIVFNAYKNQILNNVLFVKIPFKNTLHEIMEVLYEKSIQSIIVEGGAFTLNEFIKANLWDEARVFTADINLETGILSPIIEADCESETVLQKDVLKVYYNPAPI